MAQWLKLKSPRTKGSVAGAAGAGARLCVAFGHVEHGCCKDLHFGLKDDEQLVSRC